MMNPIISPDAVKLAEFIEKFDLLMDLGIITVPNDYKSENRLTMFGRQNSKKFRSYNDNITDNNFSNPTRILKPGDKLRVRAFQQVVAGITTSEERLAFLVTQKHIYTGPRGMSIVFDQKRDQLPKGKWYASFDEKDCLGVDSGRHGMPDIHCRFDGNFEFELVHHEYGWNGKDVILCYNEVE